MAIQIAYINALPSNQGVGQNFNYGVVLPPPGISGGAIRVTMKAGQGGTLPLESVFVGHKGPGTLDYDGGQASLGGATIPAGGQIQRAAAMAVDGSKPIIVMFDAKGATTGRQYSYADTPGMATFYHQGLGGAANGLDVRPSTPAWLSLSNRTMVIAKIEVAESLTDFATTEPEPIPEEKATGGDWVAALLNSELASSSGTFEGESGKCLHFIFRNPIGSGVYGLMHRIVITPDADTIITVRGDQVRSGAPWNVELTELQKCNPRMMLGGHAPYCSVYKYALDTPQGSEHDRYKIKGGEPYTLELPWPLFGTAPHALQGVSLAIHSQGVGATIGTHWHEKSIPV